MKTILTVMLLTLMIVPAAAAAVAPPEVCNSSIMSEGPILLYGAGFDDDSLAALLQVKPAEGQDFPVTDEKALAASIGRVRSGKAYSFAAPAAADRGWKKVEQKEANIMLCPGSTPAAAAPAAKLLWVRNSKGVGRPWIIEKPEIWGTTPRAVEAGGTVTVWGANVGEVFALVPASGGDPVIISGHRPYNDHSHRPAIKFLRRLVLPEGTAPGEYDLYNWNGFSDAGWSKAFRLWVAAPVGERAVINVADMGAKGDGNTDDTAAVLAAIAAAGKVKGKVFFPAGRYVIRQSLELPEGVGLEGVSPEATVIEAGGGEDFGQGTVFPMRYPGGPRDGYQTCLVWMKSGCSLDNLGLDSRGTLRINTMVAIGDPVKSGHPAYVVCRSPRVRNCRLLSHTSGLFMGGDARYSYKGAQSAQGILITTSTEDMVLEHNVIQTPASCVNHWPSYSRGASIRYNRLSTLDLHTGYTIWTRRTLQDSLIEGNYFENGGRSSTEQTHVVPYPAVHNCYYNNVFRWNRNGDGEQLMEETGGLGWFGRATAAGPDSISSAGAAWNPSKAGAPHGSREGGLDGQTLVITSGRGFGQFRSIVSNTADTITVDRPWDITPDKTTGFGVMWGGVVECLYIGNEFYFSQFYSGIFGSGLRNVWCNEVMESMGGGTWMEPISDARVMYFNLIYGNKYHERAGIVMINQRTVSSDTAAEKKEAVLALPKSVGNEVRGCSFRNRSYSPAKGGNETSMIRRAWTRDVEVTDIPPILSGMDTDMAFLPGREAALAVWDSLRWGGYPTEKGLEKMPPSTRWSVFANNMVISCPVGVMVGKAVDRTFLYSNIFYNCPEPLLDYGNGTVVVDSFVKNPPVPSAQAGK